MGSHMSRSVSVTLVTYNTRQYIEPCLESILRQKYSPLEVVVVDNASMDGTRGILARYEKAIRVSYNNSNIGFAAAQNQAIARSSSDWVLVLNPDVVLAPDFIEHLIAGTSMDPRVGTICGRLLAIGRDLKVPQ